jgi:hypothetical protein
LILWVLLGFKAKLGIFLVELRAFNSTLGAWPLTQVKYPNLLQIQVKKHKNKRYLTGHFSR